MEMAISGFVVIAIIILVLLGIVVLTAGIVGLIFFLNRKK